MKLLIVEDETITQVLYKELMRIWGYDYDIASDGTEAVKLVQNKNIQYDLCIMDINMPKMSGIEATELIRESGQSFPILGCSSDDGFERKCYEAGMNDFVTKPCLPESLLAWIKGHLKY